jgi:hypothetical protein
MNPTVLSACAALLLALLWLAQRRRPVTLLRSTDASAVAALNRAQIARPLDASTAGDAAVAQAGADQEADRPGSPLAVGSGPGLPLPGQAFARRSLLRELNSRVRADATQRREAIELAGRWGHPAVLPLLRRGLRDVDPGVVAAAAAALERFRGCPRLRQGRASAQPVSLPRNVARTR